MKLPSLVAAKPAGPTAEKIAADLRAAESDLQAAESDHGQAALDAVSGRPERLQEAEKRLSECRSRSATLRAALQAAKARDEQQRRELVAGMRKTQISAMKKHLQLRDAAAVKFTGLMEEALEQYRFLLQHSEKARILIDQLSRAMFNEAYSGGAMVEDFKLIRAVANEFARISAAPGSIAQALPGSELPSATYEHQPEKIPPMIDQIRKGSNWITARLSGQEAAAEAAE